MKFDIDLGEILTKSWKITWKFKVLWIFGILSGCVSSNRSNFNFNSGGSGGGNYDNGNGEMPDFMRPFQDMRFEQAVREFLNQYLWIIGLIILVLCILWFLFYFLGMMGRIGLIKGAGKADAGAESMTFGELWTESLPYFWRMFWLTLIIGLPSFILVVVLLVGLGLGTYTAVTGQMTENSLIAMFLGIIGVFVLLICCLSLVMLVVGLIIEQSYNAIVLEDRSLLESLGRGWEVFSKNWLSVVVVGLVQGVISIVLGIVELIVNLIVLVPFFIVIIGVVAASRSAAASSSEAVLAIGILVSLCCALIILVPLSLLVSGVENTYFQSMWTLTYRRLTSLKPVLPPQVEIIEPQ